MELPISPSLSMQAEFHTHRTLLSVPVTPGPSCSLVLLVQVAPALWRNLFPTFPRIDALQVQLLYIYRYILIFFFIQLTVFYFCTQYNITSLDSLKILQTIQICLLSSGWVKKGKQQDQRAEFPQFSFSPFKGQTK